MVVVILNGCACQLSSQEKAGMDWVTEYPSNFNGKPVEFREVDENNIKNAIETLKEVPVRQISPDEAQAYTGVKLPEPSHGKYYLVRAVHGYLGSGGYEVTYDGESLLINHSSLGSCMLYYQSALVLQLQKEPNKVFVEVNVAR